MDLTPDSILKERYRIVRKLGQGGMGAVFLARDLSLDHEVALKANRNAAEGSQQFLREARLLAGLRHPNLPRVTDYFILDGDQFLVMDYVPGDDLDELVKRSGPQPLGKVLAWARQLGSALSYMHHQTPPVIHRDIKPGNIKLSAEGQAVLVDFGIAKAISGDQATATGLRGYTPGFAPPEQYGEGHTGTQTDQYALAATLYTLLSGVKPVDAIQRMLGQAVLTPLTVLAPGLPTGLQAALERGLAIKPEERYADVDAFVEAFAAGASGMPSTSDATVIAPGRALPVAPGPAPKSSLPWFWVLLGGVGGLGVLALLALGAFFVLRGGLGAVPAPSATPRPSETQPATARLEAAAPTPSPQATATLTQTATATQTPRPQATPSATLTATLSQPSATIAPLGQGGLIAFVSDRADGKTLQIWTMRAWLSDQGKIMTGEVKQLTDSPGDKRQPRWSPDGSELLYVAPGGGAGETDIWKIKADGSAPAVDLTKRKGSELDPRWSPDGKKIAFTADSRGDGVLQVYIMNADGSNLYKLSYDQDESQPVWSPKMDWLGFVMNVAGNRIFYLRAPVDPAATQTAQPYYVTPQAFDRFDLKGNLGQVSQPAWSPDGGWIAYTSLKNNAERVMLARYPLRAVDTDIIPLSNGTRDMNPAWSPDGQWLVFVSYRDGFAQIYLMRATGKSQSRLSETPGRNLDPDWQPLR